jgi:hypothetical protein
MMRHASIRAILDPPTLLIGIALLAAWT